MKVKEKGMHSTDKTMPIYIRSEEREELFNSIYEAEEENDREEVKLLLSSEYLEKICLGRTELPDYAYGHLRKLLKTEYKEWKEEKSK